MLVILCGYYFSYLKKKHGAESGTIVRSLFVLIFKGLYDILFE